MNGCLTFFKRALLGAGVIFPLVSLVGEFRTKASSAELFDPIPTWAHIVLDLIMSASIFAPLMARRWPKTLWMPAGDFLHGAGFWISFFYVLALFPIYLLVPFVFFISLTIIACDGVVKFFLVMSPLMGPLAVLAAWYVIFLRFLRKLRKRRHGLPWLYGMGFGLVSIIVAQWPMMGFKADVRGERPEVRGVWKAWDMIFPRDQNFDQ